MPVPILFVHYGDEWIRGSEQVLLDLFAALDRTRFHPVLWCNSEILAQAARNLGVLTHRSDMRYFFLTESPSFNLAFYRELLKTGRDLIERHGAALVHINSAAPNQWMLPVARSLRIPLLVHIHADYLRRPRYFLLLHQASRAVGVADNVLNGLRKDGIAPEQLMVIANGIDPVRVTTTRGQMRLELGIPPEAVVMGSVGSLIVRKGHDLVLRAFAAQQNPDARLLIVGDGPLRQELEGLARELQVSTRVVFLGNREDIASVYAAMDINVLATRAEAFGLVLVEAAMAGVPSIATRVGGVVDIVRDDENGILVQTGDVPAIAAAMDRLISDAAARRRLGDAARTDAMTRFSAKSMCVQFQTLYEQMIKAPPKDHGWLAPLRIKPYLKLFTGLWADHRSARI